MTKPVARLTTPAQMVASMPLWLGYVPTESLVAVCCHEPRGRMGLSLRFDLPAAEDEAVLAREVERRVRQQQATRVVIAVYTSAPDEGWLPRKGLVDLLCAGFSDLVVTEALLVRDGRFWSYVCSKTCCPPAGRPVEEGRSSPPVQLLEAERVLSGKVVLPDREALEASLAGPSFLAAEVARQRCEVAADLLFQAGPSSLREASLREWRRAVARFRSPPASLGDLEAASLAMSLVDVRVRDEVAASSDRDLPALLLLLEELVRRTPAPYDAPVCTLFGWLTYCQGGGSEVTIALDRALRSDPSYSMARLLEQALLAQMLPDELRRITRGERSREKDAC